MSVHSEPEEIPYEPFTYAKYIFKQPEKAIASQDHIEQFKSSQTCRDLGGFIQTLAKAV